MVSLLYPDLCELAISVENVETNVVEDATT